MAKYDIEGGDELPGPKMQKISTGNRSKPEEMLGKVVCLLYFASESGQGSPMTTMAYMMDYLLQRK